MGHYASEMAGPGHSDEDALRWIEEEREGLASDWANGLKMAIAYPHSRSKRTCPQCYARVPTIFLRHHDDWHLRLKTATVMGFGI